MAAIFFLYVLYIRVYDIADTFLMLGEQTRDWAIALGGITELPLTGAPSTAGGRGFGPVYYWLLWLGRNLVGPFTDFLPHAGGFTVALLQSIADTWLLLALWRRVGPLLALAMCLVIASAPFDIAISSVIWNPPVAAALIKMATAMALGLGDTPPRWKIVVTAVLAWCAVQAHLSAIFVAAPLLARIGGPAVVEEAVARIGAARRRRRRRRARLADSLLHRGDAAILRRRWDPPPRSATWRTSSAFRLDRSYASVVNGAGELLVRQFDSWRFQIPTLIAAIIVVVKWRRDIVLLATSVGGIAGATILFATWTRGYDSYWFLTLTTAMVLTYGMAIAAIPSRMAIHAAGGVLLAVILFLQPSRIDQSKAFFKYPPYRTMRIASYELAARAPVLRDIRVNFEGAHPTMDKYFMYKILGGRIDPSAPQQAFVNGDGSVRIE